MSYLFKRLNEKGEALTQDRAKWNQRADKIVEGMHSKQRTCIDSIISGYKYLSVRCPRRAGKSFNNTSIGLWYGEKFPGSRVLIISLTLKSTIDNYWAGAPGGLFFQNDKYGLELKFNHTRFQWTHQNGSRGQLAGAETLADIERIRGALAEADVAIVDECKSFAPELLNQLIRDVLLPGLMTRNGILILSGTPGSIPVGPFYDATSTHNRVPSTDPRFQEAGKPTCILVGEEGQGINHHFSHDEQMSLWRLHYWTIKDNTGPKNHGQQWIRALADKERAGWTDDDPAWRREYLGEWVTDSTDLVYSWAGYKDRCIWQPEKSKSNPSGLPQPLGPWHFVLGIDLGFVDDSALVLCAYSEQLNELRHVYDFKAPGMTVDDFVDELFNVIDRYGRPEAIVADTAGGGSKMLVETLNQRYGLGVEPAKKTEKQDHIELVNSDFAAGRIKILPDSDLANELSGLQWDLSKDSKIKLLRTGRLREDPACPNHLCDALLYLYRYSYHFWSQPIERGPEYESREWWKLQEQRAIEKAINRKKGMGNDPHGFSNYINRRGRFS